VTPKIIEDWALEFRQVDPFVAPERSPLSLSGFIPGKAERVITSPVVKVEGKLVTTSSGSLYQLGQVSTKYRAFLESDRLPIDWENPLASRIGSKT
jgi:hypothetical protein